MEILDLLRIVGVEPWFSTVMNALAAITVCVCATLLGWKYRQRPWLVIAVAGWFVLVPYVVLEVGAGRIPYGPHSESFTDANGNPVSTTTVASNILEWALAVAAGWQLMRTRRGMAASAA